MSELSFQHFLLGIIAVANNIPAIPVYLDLCKELDKRERVKLCRIATLTSFITMITAMVTGMAVLNFFDISISAFRIAGGILLVNTGLSMMKTFQQPINAGKDSSFSKIISLAVIPVAIPLTTGAGTMSTVILFAEQTDRSGVLKLKLLGAIACMTAIIYVTFRYSTSIIKLLGETGMDVLSKIFGLITLALGIQFVITGVQGAFPKF